MEITDENTNPKVVLLLTKFLLYLELNKENFERSEELIQRAGLILEV